MMCCHPTRSVDTGQRCINIGGFTTQDKDRIATHVASGCMDACIMQDKRNPAEHLIRQLAGPKIGRVSHAHTLRHHIQCMHNDLILTIHAPACTSSLLCPSSSSNTKYGAMSKDLRPEVDLQPCLACCQPQETALFGVEQVHAFWAKEAEEKAHQWCSHRHTSQCGPHSG